MFFRTHLLDRQGVYIIAGNEVVSPKSGDRTYGLLRFFSSLHGKAIPGLSLSAVSIVSIKERRSYPMVIEQIVRDDTASASASSAPTQQEVTEKTTKHPRASKGKPIPQ